MDLPISGAQAAIESVGDELPQAPTASEVARVLPLHERLVLWVIEHPTEPYKNAAEFFGVTPSWIYYMTSTDMFKARVREVVAGLGVKPCLADLQAKLAGATEMAIEKLANEVERSEDPTFILNAAKVLLDRDKGNTKVVVNNDNSVRQSYSIDARVLAVAEARREVLDRAKLELAAQPIPAPGEVLVPSPDSELLT